MQIFANIQAAPLALPLRDVRLCLDEGGWDGALRLPGSLHQALIREGEAAAAADFPALPAGLYRQFGRIGNRLMFENAYFARRTQISALAYAEAVEGLGRFLDPLVDRVWALLEESTWVLPAHNAGQLCREFDDDIHNVDLFSAATAGVLALVLHLVGERLDADLPDHLLTRRIKYEIHRRVLLPVSRYDMAWMDRLANNWNPWIFSNCLFCLTVCEEDDAFRGAFIDRVIHLMDNFIRRYGDSGGCDEGPSYWNVAGGCLFDCLELLFDLTGGQLDLFDHPLVRSMGEYILNMHIHGRYFVPFADAPHVLQSDDLMIARFGRRVKSPALEQFGLSRLEELRTFLAGAADSVGAVMRAQSPSTRQQMPFRGLKNLLGMTALPPAEAAVPRPLCQYMGDVQVMTARQFPVTDKGLFLAVKGGHNNESHNHNDVGSFVVYADGQPLICDAGVDTYSRTTFSPARYSLWYMQSSYHNLPDIGGFAEHEGGSFHAEEVVCRLQEREIGMELRAAYPAEAGIRRFHRTLRLTDGEVQMCDAFELEHPADVEQHLMLREAPDLTREGVIGLGGYLLTYPDGWRAHAETVSLLTEVDLAEGQDPRGNMARNWGQDVLYRVTLSRRVEQAETFTLSLRLAQA